MTDCGGLVRVEKGVLRSGKEDVWLIACHGHGTVGKGWLGSRWVWKVRKGVLG